MRRAAHPSGFARCGAVAGCSTTKYQFLTPLQVMAASLESAPLHAAQGGPEYESLAGTHPFLMLSDLEGGGAVHTVLFEYPSTILSPVPVPSF